MKYRVVILAAAVVLAAVTAAWASNLDGKWVAQIPGRAGQTRETTFTFKVEGAKLTGTVSGVQGEAAISDGKVDGDEISFTQSREAQGNSIKLIYTGKVSGDEIKMTRKRDGTNRPATEFTAKRVK